MENDQTLRRYFLGELPRHKHRLIEKSFFEDDRLFERLLSTEERLISDYVRGALPERERLRFENYFLTTPQRRQRVKEMSDAEAVKPPVRPVTPRQVVTPSRGGLLLQLKRLRARTRGSRPMLQVAFAVITLALLGGVWAALVRLSRQPSRPIPGQAVMPPDSALPEIAKVQTPQQPDAKTASPATPPSPSPSPGSSPPPKPKRSPGPPTTRESLTLPSPMGPVVAATLPPGLMRGEGQVPIIEITFDTPTVILRAKLTERKFDRYSATLLDEERRQVRRWRVRAPQVEGNNVDVVFDIPARRLSDGYYYLLLYGVPAKGAKVKDDTYPFQVERQ
jgi:hypothetical protein